MKQNVENMLKEAIEREERFRLEQQEAFKKIFLEATKSIFEELPALGMIAFPVYTPVWNDGDECNFTIGEVGFFNEIAAENLEEIREESFYDVYENEEYVLDSPESDKMCSLFAEFLNQMSHSIEGIYGTNSIFYILKNGEIIVDDYDCGY